MSLLAGMALASPPTSASAGSTFAVTEVHIGYSIGSVAADPTTHTTYVASNVGGVAAIDSASDTLTGLISLPIHPYVVAVDQSTDTVYAIANGSANTPGTADVINGATNAVTASIGLSTGFRSFGAAANSVTHMVYVADEVHGTVAVIDGSTDPPTLAATIALADPPPAPSPEPLGLAVDTATNTIYITDPRDDQVAVINGANNTLTGRIDLPASSVPMGVAVDPATGLLYTLDAGTGKISVIDTATDTVSTLASGLATGTTSAPLEGLALDSGSGALYATVPAGASNDELGITYVIDAASGAIMAQIPRGGSWVAVAGSGGSAFIGGIGGLLGGDVPVITPSAVNTMSPVIINPNFGSISLTFTVGQASQDQLTASATPAATFTENGALPAGITLSPSGLLSGTPTAGTGGTYGLSLTAANGVAPSYTTALNLTIDEAPAITSADQAAFGAGVASSFAVTANGYPAPTFSETGQLPAGITLSPAGVLSGTPAAGTAGGYPIQITATNGLGSATQAFTLTVTAAAPAAAVGAEGGNGQLSVQAPQLASGWQSLGGQITGPPAVAAPPNANGTTPADPVFFATGSNGELWMRSLTAGWAPVGPSEAFCIGSPAAVVANDGTLTVACEGLNQQLYYNTTSLPSSGLPSFTGAWTSLGGILSAGPAVAPVGGTTTFFAEGTNGQIFTATTAAAGYTATPWFCTGAPAAATQATSGTATFACQGGDHALWTAANSGSGWSSAISLGGQLSGGPGIAATSLHIEYVAEGTDGTIWEWTASGGWTSLGGTAVGGTGATALN